MWDGIVWMGFVQGCCRLAVVGWNYVSRPDPVTKWKDLVCGGFLDTNSFIALPGLWVDLWDISAAATVQALWVKLYDGVE